MFKTRKRFGLFLITAFLTSLLCLSMYVFDNKYHQEGLQASDGLLHVSQKDLDAHPINYLVNGWAFYPDTLMTPQDFSAGNPNQYLFYTSIGERTRFDSTGNPNDPHGCGSYFLRLRLPENTHTYALELPEIYSAYKLYIGERLVLQMGNPEKKDYTPQTQNRVVTFEASGKTTILLAVSDYSHFYSGMVYPPAFGTSQAVILTRELRIGISLFANTIVLLAAVLTFYFGVRMKHQNARIFSLFCIVMCIFTSYSIIHTMLALPIFPWYAMELLSGYVLSLIIVILHNHICDINPLVRRISVEVIALFCLISLCYGLLSAYLTVPVMQMFSIFIFLFKAALSIYLLSTALSSLKKSNRQAAPLFYASIIYATTFLWDRLLPEYEPVLSGWFIEWGSLSLAIAIGYTLWRDITSAYANSIIFAEEHRMMKRQLTMQSEYALQMQKDNEKSNKLTHDFRQHLRTIMGISLQLKTTSETAQKQKELITYLDSISQSIVSVHALHKGRFCENVAVDALLQYYNTVAENLNFNTEFHFQLPQNLNLTDIELCTVLGNLLENAIDACSKLTDTKKYIRILTEMNEDTFLLMVENSYNGIHKQMNGQFFSSKENKNNRIGIGLESTRNIIEGHGGTLSTYPLESQFRIGITLPTI